MTDLGSVVVVGGSAGIGLELARHYAAQDRRVYVTSRDAERAKAAARAIGGDSLGLSLDLSRPREIAPALAAVEDVAHLALLAVDRDENRLREYNLDGALNLVTLKLVGYTEAIHTLAPRLRPDASIVLFGGLAKDRPYLGSTTVTTINGGVMTMTHTLALELAPIRVNALHPGVVGDSPYWANKPAAARERFAARTPLGRLVTMAEVVGAAVFLLENSGVNGINLNVDGGWLLT